MHASRETWRKKLTFRFDSHDMILIDEIHRCGSLGTGQGLQGGLTIGLPPLYNFGSEELQDRVIPEILSGKKRICLAITEPEVRSNAFNELYMSGRSPLDVAMTLLEREADKY